MTLFLLLLLAHVLGDFSLQPLSWVQNRKAAKWRSPKLVYHVLVHGTLSALAVAAPKYWYAVAILMICHWLTDVWKSYQQESLGTYLADQLLHLLVIALLSLWLVKFQGYTSPWAEVFDAGKNLDKGLVITLGLLLLLRPASMVVQYFMNNFDLSEPDSYALENAGKWIGYFERTIILLSVLMGAYSVLGFLVAAKSLLRFNERKADRKHTEYVLVGSLLSWTIGIAVALAAAKYPVK